MLNDEGETVDLYIPRKWYVCNVCCHDAAHLCLQPSNDETVDGPEACSTCSHSIALLVQLVDQQAHHSEGPRGSADQYRSFG